MARAIRGVNVRDIGRGKEGVFGGRGGGCGSGGSSSKVRSIMLVDR